MRFTLLLVFLAVLAGCASKRPSLVAQTAPPTTNERAVVLPPDSDPIAALVARLTATNGTWVNGVIPIIEVPLTASTQQVLERVFKRTGFDKGNVWTFQIIETRQVQIPAPGFSSDAFTAVLVETNLGRKIVLFSSSSSFRWSRVYDA
jgi:hypothetical protein